MNIPQFLYVPQINTVAHNKLIIETRSQVYWIVREFDNYDDLLDYAVANKAESEGFIAFNMHRKYPIALLCIGTKSNISEETLIKIGNLACDWYVQFFFKNKELSKLNLKNLKNPTKKTKEYFKHWIYGDNSVSDDESMYLINLKFGMVVKFNDADAYFADFETFKNEIAEVFFLKTKPDEGLREKLLVDAWNFLLLYDKKLEDGNLGDIDNDVFFNPKL